MKGISVWFQILAILGSYAMSTAATAQDPATIAVIGTGRVGTALGPRFAALGMQVIYGSRDPSKASVHELVAKTGNNASAASQAEAAQAADWIVLAIPWTAVENLIPSLGPLDGKVIIDITNAISFGEDGLMVMAVDSSAGELIQQWAPGAKVVKAFNAVGYHIMANPAVAGGAITIPLAGDDSQAKSAVASVVQRLGFETVDVGPIKHAHHLEGMAVLYMVPYLSKRPDEAFEFYFRKGTGSSAEVRPAE
ncbi:MAG: NAD(P)-binding domain-containing protein [Gammaproteobacteria bacterium]